MNLVGGAVQVERFVRQEDGDWRLTVFKGLDASLEFTSLDCAVPLSQIYEDIKFGPEESAVVER